MWPTAFSGSSNLAERFFSGWFGLKTPPMSIFHGALDATFAEALALSEDTKSRVTVTGGVKKRKNVQRMIGDADPP